MAQDLEYITYSRGLEDTPPAPLRAQFYRATEAITDLNGNPTGEYRDFVKIKYRIDSQTREDRPVVLTEKIPGTDMVTVIGDDLRFPEEWARFQAQKETGPVIDVNHLTLEDWLKHEGAAQAFAAYGINTVEQLANADIAQIKIDGAEKYAAKAKAYLEERDLKNVNQNLLREIEQLRKKQSKNAAE